MASTRVNMSPWLCLQKLWGLHAIVHLAHVNWPSVLCQTLSLAWRLNVSSPRPGPDVAPSPGCGWYSVGTTMRTVFGMDLLAKSDAVGHGPKHARPRHDETLSINHDSSHLTKQRDPRGDVWESFLYPKPPIHLPACICPCCRHSQPIGVDAVGRR